LGDELLKREVFYSLLEARVIIEAWRRHYNTIRPHSALGYRPPAPEAILPRRPIWPALSMGSGQIRRDQRSPPY
jgi:transposase InsO family protein